MIIPREDDFFGRPSTLPVVVERQGKGKMTGKISFSATRIRFPRLMTIGIVTASLFGIAGTVQTAEVRHEAGEHLKPTGKGWGEHDESGWSARNARTFGNAMLYHGGPVMLGTPNIYYIWYGSWTGNTAPGILTNLAQNFWGSPLQHQFDLLRWDADPYLRPDFL
jgi:hypothetical protein